jgi:hypothetical protein
MFIKKIIISVLITLLLIITISLIKNIDIDKAIAGLEYINYENCNIPADVPKELENILDEAMQDIPCYLLQSLQKVEIFEDNKRIFPRAMANSRIIKVRKDAIGDKDIINVLIHELGHVVDLGGLKSSSFDKKSNFKDGSLIFYEDDISLMYYKISWNHKHIKPNSSYLDFVGGYSKHDMFEDFSESFLLYIKHGKYFRQLALSNKKLRKKYMFFKNYVFNGKEFNTGKTQTNLNKRHWDITIL